MNLALAFFLLSSSTQICDSLVPSDIIRHNRSSNNNAPQQQQQQQRREILRSAAVGSGLTLINYLAILLPTTQKAHAVKPSNEALCGTGFFTNIAQYYCTDIGDISDEGKSRKLSVEETSSLDSLMNKLDLGDSGTLLPSSSSEGNGGNESSGNRNDDQGSSPK